MKRKAILGIAVLVVVTVLLLFTGCEPAEVTEAKALLADLPATFTGTVPETQEAALATVSSAMTGPTMAMMMDTTFKSDFQTAMSDVTGLSDILPSQNVASQLVLSRMLNSVFGNSAVQSRDISMTGEVEEATDENSMGGTGTITLTVTDEEISGDEDGTITLNADATVEGSGAMTSEHKIDVDVAADAEASLVIAGLQSAYDQAVTQLDGNIQIDFDLGVDQVISINETTYEPTSMILSYDGTMNLTSAMVISGTTGGKFILTLTLSQAVTDLTVDLTAEEPDVPEDVEVTAYLMVYDADDKLVGEYEYTQENIDDLIEAMIPSQS